MAQVDTHSAGAGLPGGTKIIDRLAQEAFIDREQYQRVLMHAQRGGDRCEDALVELGYMSEPDLLKYLANIYRTRFVSTAKLAKAKVPAPVLQMVPRRVCERLTCCPILFDRKTQALSVVAADLEEHDVEKQLQLVSGAREVKAYIARPATIQALVRKHYDGDSGAFIELQARSPSTAPASLGPPVERTAANMSETLGEGRIQGSADYYEDANSGSGLFDLGLEERREEARRAGRPPTQPGTARRPPVALTIEAPEIAADLARGVAETTTSLGTEDYLQTLNVLVALLERERDSLRGHSSQVVRLSRRLCERIGLSERQMHGILVAGYLHDIGKASSYHLTALNVAQYEGHRIQAEKTYLTPVKMFDSVHLPDSAVDSLAHVYERYDGKGFPDRQAGKDIPLGARVLAIVETYLDLTTHDKNPYRKKLTPPEACDALDRYKGQFFDPNMVDVFKTVVLGDDLKAKLLSDRQAVLIVDTDPEETTVLELRLVDAGFEVSIARNATDALKRIARGGIDAVVSELDLTPFDGFEMLSRIHQSSREVPVMFLTRRGDRDAVNRGFELGVADFLVKPASADVVAAKVRQIVDQRARKGGRGVAGSLSEMSLPDVVQILSNGRKSGRLAIRANGRTGAIWFSDGSIWDASFGAERAEEAFYAMLLLADGEFTLEPDARPERRTIQQSTESLLLEGMRRFDEGRR